MIFGCETMPAESRDGHRHSRVEAKKGARYRRYLSVISASGCETIVMNQTALKNSDQNVSQ
jgi:hypothetical protein